MFAFADPRAFVLIVALAVVLVLLVPFVVLLVIRAAWHMARKPVGELSVFDAALGGLAWRWWRHHQARRGGGWPQGQRGYSGATWPPEPPYGPPPKVGP